MKRPSGVVVASSLMILFGIIEIATGFSHNFVGISTSTSAVFTVAGAAIGAFYSIAGLLTLTMKRRAILGAIALLIADVVGRLGLVESGLFSLNSIENIAGIVGGTIIALVLAAYLSLSLNKFFPNRPAGNTQSGQPKS